MMRITDWDYGRLIFVDCGLRIICLNKKSAGLWIAGLHNPQKIRNP